MNDKECSLILLTESNAKTSKTDEVSLVISIHGKSNLNPIAKEQPCEITSHLLLSSTLKLVCILY